MRSSLLIICFSDLLRSFHQANPKLTLSKTTLASKLSKYGKWSIPSSVSMAAATYLLSRFAHRRRRTEYGTHRSQTQAVHECSLELTQLHEVEPCSHDEPPPKKNTPMRRDASHTHLRRPVPPTSEPLCSTSTSNFQRVNWPSRHNWPCMYTNRSGRAADPPGSESH